MRPFLLGDQASLIAGNKTYMPGIIVGFMTAPDGEEFACLAYTQNHQRWYPVWQLVPDGITCLTFRHLLFSFLKPFNKKLVLRATDC